MLRQFAGLIFALLVALPTSAEVMKVKVKAGANTTTVAVPAGYAENTLTIYTQSVGNVSTYMTLILGGPANLSATAKYGVANGTINSMLRKNSLWMDLPFIVGSGKNLKTLTLKASSVNPSTPTPDPGTTSCGGLKDADIAYLIALFKQTIGVSYTRDDICKMYDPNYKPGYDYKDGDNDSGGGNSARFAIHKDTCGTKKGAVYLVRLDLSLAKVDATARAEGFEIQIGIREDEYSGGKAASIKPTSDGKFAPQPLFLLQALGGWAGTGMKGRVVRWANGKVRSIREQRVEDMIFWRGRSFARMVASKHLTGGKASVELDDGAYMYSVCFKMVRSRQRVNGY